MTVLTHPVTRWTGPAIPEAQVLNVHFNARPGTKLVEDRACSYCWATFTQKRTTQYHCSPACSKRDSAWNSWIRQTNYAATHGDVHSTAIGPKLPPAGATLTAAIASSQLMLEVEAVAS